MSLFGNVQGNFSVTPKYYENFGSESAVSYGDNSSQSIFNNDNKKIEYGWDDEDSESDNKEVSDKQAAKIEKKIDKLNNKIDKYNEEIAKLNDKIADTDSDKKIEKYEKKIAKLQEKIAKREAEIEELEDKLPDSEETSEDDEVESTQKSSSAAKTAAADDDDDVEETGTKTSASETGASESGAPSAGYVNVDFSAVKKGNPGDYEIVASPSSNDPKIKQALSDWQSMSDDEFNKKMQSDSAHNFGTFTSQTIDASAVKEMYKNFSREELNEVFGADNMKELLGDNNKTLSSADDKKLMGFYLQHRLYAGGGNQLAVAYDPKTNTIRTLMPVAGYLNQDVN